MLRMVTCAGAGLAVLTVLCVPASSGASPRTAAIAAPVRGVQLASPRRRGGRRHAVVAAGCNASDSTSFVGIAGESDFAGTGSAVPGGLDNEACDDYDAIGGGAENIIGGNGLSSDASFIGAGENNAVAARSAFIGSGENNAAEGYAAFVGAGFDNFGTADSSFVGGGGSEYYGVQFGNHSLPTTNNLAAGVDSFVGGGDLNAVSGPGSFIGSGGFTYAASGAKTAGNQVAGTDSFVGAGNQNNVAANQAFIGGGEGNVVIARATYAAIAGGIGGKAGGTGAAIGGGEANLASGVVATIPGGYHNVASGIASFAAGFGAQALTNGAFVWADESSTARVKSSLNNQFLARASGGVYFYSNAASTVGVRLAAGSGAWSSLSDRNMKTEIAPLDAAAVLDKVDAMPVSVWSYRTEPGVRHVGPMAQDFYAAFGVGEDNRHITSIDEDGVALAAIKALHAENRVLRQRLARDAERFARDEAKRSLEDARRLRDEALLLELKRKVEALAAR